MENVLNFLSNVLAVLAAMGLLRVVNRVVDWWRTPRCEICGRRGARWVRALIEVD